MSVVRGSLLHCARKVLFWMLCSIGILCVVRPANAVGDTFPARATFKLCAGYTPGNFSLELKYRLPYEFQYRTLTVTGESVNLAARTATVNFQLPIRMGVSEVRI